MNMQGLHSGFRHFCYIEIFKPVTWQGKIAKLQWDTVTQVCTLVMVKIDKIICVNQWYIICNQVASNIQYKESLTKNN